jgi:peptidoglycan/LPS O-acetylase OafA/YrhL
MGYQPSLDGVRALSVVAVILYHAGFGWMKGGFFGVEVFFVVSGFLITSLLIEERDRNRRIDLRQFWVRRWRRLLPALFAMLLVVSVWAVFFGTAEQHTQLRRDLPWGILYLANWGQILSDTPYFAGTPTLLRHLWSLAVEEQWYVLWPLVFLGIALRGRSDRRLGRSLATVSAVVMVGTAAAHLAGVSTNFLYLSTLTRSSGLLMGAAMAFLWRPWRVAGRPRAQAARTLDLVAGASALVLLASFLTGHVSAGATYLWQLPLVTLASTALVAVVVHPWASVSRRVFGSRPMVEVGKRSYGLYLWTWPVSRITDAYTGSWPRFAVAMLLAVPLSEACYRWVETPIRKGALGRWFADRRAPGWGVIAGCSVVGAVALMLPLAAFYRSAAPTFDAAVDAGGSEVVFELQPGSGTAPPASATPSSDSSPGQAATTSPAVPVTSASLPRRLVIVGDSMAHSLKVNLPDGIEATFAATDGSVEGCSVYDSGKAVSARDGFSRSFGGCAGWEQKWSAAAQQGSAELALVVLGAWDVFDVQLDGQTLPFASAANDQRFVDGLQRGIDALAAVGTKVALLEVACMRPQDVKGAGVPALPERGDDTRVAHVNELLRRVAAANSATTTFVTGPAEYCSEPVASDLAYRWDGVHAFKPGAKLTMETIAGQLLSIPVP